MITRLMLAATLLSPGLAAQVKPPERLSPMVLEKGTCAKCEFTLEYAVTVGHPNDQELIPDHAGLFAPTTTDFFVITYSPVSILRFDGTGRYIGTFGRVGDGPGEFRFVAWLTRGYGDSIAIWGSSRLTILSREGTGRSMTVDLSRAISMGLRSDGEIVIQDGGNGELPIFVNLSRAGVIGERFGPTTPMTTLPDGRQIRDREGAFRLTTPSRSDGLWSAPTSREHRLEHWGTNGKLLREVARKPAWFTPYDRTAYWDNVRLGPMRTPVLPQISGLWVSEAKALYVTSSLADANWKKDPNAPPPTPPGREIPIENFEPTGGIDRYLDTVVEIYDEASGALLGTWRFDRARGAFTESGLVAFPRTDPDGVKHFDLYRPVLKRR